MIKKIEKIEKLGLGFSETGELFVGLLVITGSEFVNIDNMFKITGIEHRMT